MNEGNYLELQENNDQLNSSLFALTSHFAQVLFRIHFAYQCYESNYSFKIKKVTYYQSKHIKNKRYPHITTGFGIDRHLSFLIL